MEAPDVIALPARRNPERGNSLVLAMIVLTGLGTLSVLTVLGVRAGFQTTANNRFRTIAMYAAESGGAAAMQYLRTVYDRQTKWSAIPFSANNETPHVPEETALFGNGVASGAAGNPFDNAMQAMYRVEIINNRDAGYATGVESDERIVIRSTGYGPEGAVAIIEWEVATEATSVARPCSTYAQRSQSDDNAGVNDCLQNIDITSTESFTP